MARNVVLLGIGHTNAHVVRKWRRSAPAGAQLICVSDFPAAAYSGMLPGLLAGQYNERQMRIELEPLCRAAGAELILSTIADVDLSSRQIHFADRPPISFDILSVGIGSVPAVDRFSLGPADVPIKPMQTLIDRLQHRLRAVVHSAVRPVQLVVVGGGVGGLEVALCIPARLRRELGQTPFTLALVHSGQQLAPGLARRTARLAQQELERRGVKLMLGRRVAQAAAGVITLDTGEQLRANVIRWATHATASPLLARFALPVDPRGFLLTRPTLQSTGDDRVFAVGDAGTIHGKNVPKAGVYAVRQGPILWSNILRLLNGQQLKAFSPQGDFLKLLNSGDGQAIGEYHGWTFRGRWAWRLKDAIDRTFVGKYQC